MAGDGLSIGAIIGIALGGGSILAILIVATCIIRSRSQRKQRKFRHTFRGTLKHDPGATLTSLSRVSNKVEKRPDTVYHITKRDLEPRYAPMHPHKPVQINIASADHAAPSTYPVITRKEKGAWLLPDEKYLRIPVQEEANRGKRSPVLLRLGRPPKPLPRNIYTNVPARGSQLCRSNSDCSSVISYDLGDPRNSPAVKRHSSLYFPPQSHRHRTDTIDTARSSGIAMDLGEGMHKAWMMLDTDYFRKHSITRL